MHFPHEVTKSEEIQQGDKIEVTWNNDGSVMVGTVKEICSSREHRNGHLYDLVRVAYAGGNRTNDLSVDKSMRGMGFSIRILARPRTYKTGDFIPFEDSYTTMLHSLPEGVIVVTASRRDGSVGHRSDGFYILKGIDD